MSQSEGTAISALTAHFAGHLPVLSRNPAARPLWTALLAGVLILLLRGLAPAQEPIGPRSKPASKPAPRAKAARDQAAAADKAPAKNPAPAGRNRDEVPNGNGQPAPDANAPDDAPAGPVGQFLTITAPLNDGLFGQITNAALKLSTVARQENRKAILVLELRPGTSAMHQVLGLAKFISNDLTGVTTVAWVPETVRGNHVILALACQDIVMHPTAELGDIGNGRPLDPDELAFVLNLVHQRRNLKLSEPLIRAMTDPQAELIWAQIERRDQPGGGLESRLMLSDEFNRLLDQKVVVAKQEVVKPAGVPGVFSGEKSRSYDFLAVQTALSRDELTALYKLPREAMREPEPALRSEEAILIRITDQVNHKVEQFVIRQIDRAAEAGKKLIVFEIDSQEGLREASSNIAGRIAQLKAEEIRSVAVIARRATGGAALIALATDEIYMEPEARLGDALPVEMRDPRQPPQEKERSLSILKQIVQELAQAKGRPPALYLAMIDPSTHVLTVTNKQTGQVSYMTDVEIPQQNEDWQPGPELPETMRNEPVILTGQRAHELRLAEPPVESPQEARLRLGFADDHALAIAQHSWVDALVFELQTPGMMFTLMVIGIFCIYLELHFPSGLFGIGALLCFALIFWSQMLGGTAGWLEVLLFILGGGLLAVEIFLIPGFGLFGFVGLALMLVSLVLATQTFVVPMTRGDWHSLAGGLGTIGGAIAGAMVSIAVASRFLPQIPLLRGMILEPPGSLPADHGPRLDPSLTGSESRERPTSGALVAVGTIGVTQTMLRPAGKVRFPDGFYDVMSDGPFIAAGTQVEVVESFGRRIVVRTVEES